jgi:lyso-ornithine lipid O-acyltransferase
MGMLSWLLVSAPLHVLTLVMFGRSGWSQRFLGGIARIAGIRIRVVGEPVRAPALLISNHRSWIDIPVLAATTDCAFVAKSELGGHWLLRWLCRQNKTVFIDRGDRRSVGTQAQQVQQVLQRERPLVLFAEGTVSPEAGVLPFRPPLLAAVAPAPQGVAVRPVAIDYGAAWAGLAWIGGESLGANFVKVMRRRGPIAVTVYLLPALAPSADRKALAQAAQVAVEGALALSCAAPLPYSRARP